MLLTTIEIPDSLIPKGHKAKAFRVASPGEKYLGENGKAVISASGTQWPVLILKEKPAEYRDVTPEDIGEEVEVRDHGAHQWVRRKLTAIMGASGDQGKYIALGANSPYSGSWWYARIQVKEE